MDAPGVWGPSFWARTFLRAARWRLTWTGESATLDTASRTANRTAGHVAGRTRQITLDELGQLNVRNGWVWSAISWPGLVEELGGLRPDTVQALQAEISAALDRRQQQARFAQDSAALLSWWADVSCHLGRPRWIARDQIRELNARRLLLPGGLSGAVTDPVLADLVAQQPPQWWQALRVRQTGLTDLVDQHNQTVLENEPTRLADFFATVEKTPLNPEQVQAVLCFDNRVQVVAAAGSGKTSTMVARAAYAAGQGFVAPERILVLAFNHAAAKQVGDRLQARLGPTGILSSTFHRFGLQVITDVLGHRPPMSQEAKERGGLALIERLVGNLCETDPSFAANWTMFRLVFADELPPFGSEEDRSADTRRARENGLLTLDGKIVRSHEEQMIADWLHVNGVDYAYEHDYAHPTAGTHQQYKPDFYYPDIDVWHEHFALDRHGQPPAHFKGYLDGVAWKRELHQQMGTTLIETTSAGIRDGSGFTHLAAELTRRGITVQPRTRPDVDLRRQAHDQDLYELLNTFLSNTKSNLLKDADLRSRARLSAASPIRTRLFLDVFLPVRAAWDQRLSDSNTIDFHDMINQATELIRAGRWTNPYELVMVDEFQDTSVARTALVEALLDAPHRYLFTVGDDWQSINRFAGADPSIMADFDDRFGPGSRTVRLQQTFRFPQSLCDIAGRFVSRNPAQLAKTVTSEQPETSPTVRAVACPAAPTRRSPPPGGPEMIPAHREICRHLGQLHTTHLEAARTATTPTPRTSVRILSRYNRTLKNLQDTVPVRNWPGLDITFTTVHRSKGDEAEHVIVVDLEDRRFPCARADDPLLAIAQPRPDPYPLRRGTTTVLRRPDQGPTKRPAPHRAGKRVPLPRGTPTRRDRITRPRRPAGPDRALPHLHSPDEDPGGQRNPVLGLQPVHVRMPRDPTGPD